MCKVLGILIRNNDIIVGYVQFDLSQYAACTSLFSNGSPESIDGIEELLTTLHVYHDQE